MYGLPLKTSGLSAAYVCAGRGTAWFLRRYRHTSPLAFAVRCPAVLFSSKPICPRHPGLLLGSHQTAGGYQLHGHLTPGRIAVGCPHCLRRFFHARTVTGQEYHCPHYLSWPHREPPDASCSLLSLPGGGIGKPKTSESDFRCLHPPQIIAQPQSWLMLIATTMGMYLMNGYSIFKLQTHSPHSGKTGEDFLRPHLFPN